MPKKDEAIKEVIMKESMSIYCQLEETDKPSVVAFMLGMLVKSGKIKLE